MGLEGSFDDPRFKGWKKYFNSYTIRGRSNWAKLWISVYGVSFIAFKITRMTKKPPEEKVKQPSSELTNATISGPSTNPQLWNLPIKEHSFSCQQSGATSILPDQPKGGQPNLSAPPSHPQQPFYPCYPPPAYYPYYPPIPPHVPTQPEGSYLPKDERTQLPGTSSPPSPNPYYPPAHYYPPALYPYATPPIYSHQEPQIASVPPSQVPTVNQQLQSPNCPEQPTTKNEYASTEGKPVDEVSDTECKCEETN